IRKRQLHVRERHVRVPAAVLIDQARVVHAAEVIARQHQQFGRGMLADDMDVLIGGIRRSPVAIVVAAALGRPQLDRLARPGPQPAPPVAQVLDERVRLVLRRHPDAPDSRVRAVRERKVDAAVESGERQGRHAAPVRERLEWRAVTRGQDDGEHILLEARLAAGHPVAQVTDAGEDDRSRGGRTLHRVGVRHACGGMQRSDEWGWILSFHVSTHGPSRRSSHPVARPCKRASDARARRPGGGAQPKGAAAGNRREVHPAVVGQSDATAAGPSAPPPDFPVVAIGASAGGLEAFKRFMGAIPPDGGIAFALIPHLDPNHASLMVELLAKHTRMPIQEAGHGMVIERNHVYVIPPKPYLAFNEGVLELSRPPEARGRQTAIDFSLRSLAADRKEKAIGVIFSGTGSHGTAGIKEIKFVGGMVMVQDPATAEYDQMPRSAIATGLVDYVLAPEDMPAALLRYVNHAYLQAGPEAVSPG